MGKERSHISDQLQNPEMASASPSGDEPLWSVMLPVYNRDQYLRLALESVLAQAPDSDLMQIEVVDDCSTVGDIQAIVDEIGQGRVSYFRQPQNVGLFGNWQSCIERARGRLVHILHDDDIVLPGFYSQLSGAFEAEPTIGAAFCRHAYIDENGGRGHISKLERDTIGIVPNFLELICAANRIEICSIAVKRTVYKELGAFHRELHYCRDWDLWKRLALHHPVLFVPEVLACFRLHPGSETHRLHLDSQTVPDQLKCIEIGRAYLPANIVDRTCRQAKGILARQQLGRARRYLFRDKNFRLTLSAVQDALKVSCSPAILFSASQIAVTCVLLWAIGRCSKRGSCYR